MTPMPTPGAVPVEWITTEQFNPEPRQWWLLNSGAEVRIVAVNVFDDGAIYYNYQGEAGELGRDGFLAITNHQNGADLDPLHEYRQGQPQIGEDYWCVSQNRWRICCQCCHPPLSIIIRRPLP